MIIGNMALFGTSSRAPGWGVWGGGGRERKGVNFLIETIGKFMEDEKSSPKATPHPYPNEFMQMCCN